MTAKDLIDYWKIGADDAWTTAEILFKNKKYNHCLFFTHLAVEKIIKGLIVKKTGQPALPIHNLVFLANQTGLNFKPGQQEDLKEMTSWNMKARYDEVKYNFYKKATKKFTDFWFAKAKEYFLWFKKQY